MSLSLDLPRERYGLIAELADRMKGFTQGFGKTALQKLVYFLQELRGVNCGYEFTLYTYGPFSAQLLSDLDAVNMLDGVDITYYGANGYDIKPGARSMEIREHAMRFISKHNDDIAEIVSEFGGMSAKGLELRATIVYVERDARTSGQKLSNEQLIGIVQGLKPHFSEEAIEEASRELSRKGHIEFRRASKAVTVN